MRQQLETMFTMQERLNDDTNGEAWRRGVTKAGKVINWRRCIVMEGAELIDSFAWKHWKNIAGSVDYANARIELVDIWHFVMSELLRFLNVEEATGATGTVVEASLAQPVTATATVPEAWDASVHNLQLDAILAPFETLMELALAKEDSREGALVLNKQFWTCCRAFGLSLDELYRLYVGKNALNQFRQLHGYKEGCYRKLWGDREDNAVMQEVLQQEPDITFEHLMARLEALYLQ